MQLKAHTNPNMTDDPAAEESAAPSLFKLATKPKPVPHTWGGLRVIIASRASPSGFEEHHKTCSVCGLSRITRIGSANPRAYAVANGPQFFADVEPECVAGEGKT